MLCKNITEVGDGKSLILKQTGPPKLNPSNTISEEIWPLKEHQWLETAAGKLGKVSYLISSGLNPGELRGKRL